MASELLTDDTYGRGRRLRVAAFSSGQQGSSKVMDYVKGSLHDTVKYLCVLEMVHIL